MGWTSSTRTRVDRKGLRLRLGRRDYYDGELRLTGTRGESGGVHGGRWEWARCSQALMILNGFTESSSWLSFLPTTFVKENRWLTRNLSFTARLLVLDLEVEIDLRCLPTIGLALQPARREIQLARSSRTASSSPVSGFDARDAGGQYYTCSRPICSRPISKVSAQRRERTEGEDASRSTRVEDWSSNAAHPSPSRPPLAPASLFQAAP